MPQLDTLLVVDQSGRPIQAVSLKADARGGLDAAAWYAQNRSGLGAGLTFGLLQGNGIEPPRLIIARPVDHAAVISRGAILAVIDPTFLSEKIQALPFVRGGGSAMVLGGAALLAVSQAMPNTSSFAPAFASSIPPGPAGLFRSHLPDRKNWLLGYQRLPNQQVTVVTGLDTGGIVAQWLRRRAATVGMVTATILLLVAFAFLAGKHMKRRMAAEESLRSSEARFRDIAEAASDWIWETGPDLRITYVSQRALAAFHVEVGFFIGRSLDDIFIPDGDDGLAVALAAVRVHKPFRDRKGRIRIGDGTIRHVRLSAIPLFNEKGEFAGYRGTGTDITVELEVKRLEEQARHRLIDAVESLPHGLALFDPDDRLVLCNSRFRALYGAVGANLVPGSRFADIVESYAAREFGREPTERRVAWCEARLSHHLDPQGSFEYQSGDGRWRLVGERRTNDGGTVCVETDVTDLKQREVQMAALAAQNERLAAAVNAATSGIVITDPRQPDNPVVFVNPAFTALTGYAAEEVLGRNPRMIQGVGTAASTRERIRVALANGQPLLTDVLNYRKDGTSFWNELNLSPVHGSDGRPAYWVGIMTDVSYRKEVEQQLVDAKSAAELASRAKTEFLANMSHELRTPLNAIIGFSEILATEMFGPVGNPQYRSYALDIHTSGAHLLEIINDILDMSKIEAGKVELKEQIVDMEDVVAACIRLVRQRLDEAQHQLCLDMPPGLPYVSGDEHMLKRVVLNLLSNAVKFTPERGRIGVEARLVEDGAFTIKVWDTGIGIAPEHLEKVWAPFGQAESALQRKFEGTGLGLPLVRSMVELHGGTVAMESAIGKGTAVTIRLPADRVLSMPMSRRRANA